jgi:hypothetical protein
MKKVVEIKKISGWQKKIRLKTNEKKSRGDYIASSKAWYSYETNEVDSDSNEGDVVFFFDYEIRDLKTYHFTSLN